MEHEVYQVFSVSKDSGLCVDTVDTEKEAKILYEQKKGFLLLGVDAPTCFDVICARPYGMALIG